MVAIAGRYLVCIALTIALSACDPKGNPGKASPNPLEPSPAATTVRPPPTSLAPPNPAFDGVSEVAKDLATDRAKGIFVATNRQLLNQSLASFGDARSQSVIYGVAYQHLTAGNDGRVSPVRSTLEFQGARKAEFDKMVGERFLAAKLYPRQVVIFVHGYNQSPNAALSSGIAIRTLLRLDAPMIMFMWPSQGVLRDYPKDQAMAEASRNAFQTVLCDARTRYPDAKVSVIAHSMGNYLVANALDHLASRGGCTAGAKISNLVMMSPDIPDEKMRELHQPIVSQADIVTAYVSQIDRAVESSEVFWQGPNFGFVRNGVPIIYPGIFSIDVTSVQDINFSFMSLNHDSYSFSQIMEDVYELLRKPDPQPMSRSLRIAEMTARGGAKYYVMNGKPKGRN
ncbi:MAG: alpha/beta hydrolase [Caulobacteraceae bacterium]|nr:MAG: alpha/beta hydrolase [Caulobacteraceae bacterium]